MSPPLGPLSQGSATSRHGGRNRESILFRHPLPAARVLWLKSYPLHTKAMAYGDTETKRKAPERGADDLLTKPIDFLALRDEIETRVERAA